MSEEEIANHPVDQSYNGDAIKNNNVFVGDIKYKDLNNDGIIDWHDEKVIGTTGLPKTMYSLNLNGQFKGFSVDMLFQGGANYRVAFGGSTAAPFSNESIPTEEHYLHRAKVALDNAGKKYITNPGAKLPPVYQTGLTPNNAKNSDFWSYDTKYLRLKSLNVSYTIPRTLISKYNINQCTFYVSASNLWTISNLGIWKDSYDPEVINQNSRNYPPVKTVSLGLKLTL